MTHPLIRFFQDEHEQLLSRLDQAERAVREIGTSAFPLNDFRAHQAGLGSFFRFMEGVTKTHCRWEDHFFFPQLRSRLEGASAAGYRHSVERITKEHQEGSQRLAQLEERFRQLAESSPQEPVSYYRFCAELLELLWHYRRHVWREENILFPLALRVLSRSDLDRMRKELEPLFTSGSLPRDVAALRRGHGL